MTPSRTTMTDATLASEAGPDMLNAYDPARERAVARRMKRQRWRRIALTTTAICLAAVAAGAFTLANRDTIVTALSGGGAAPQAAAPAAAAPGPAQPVAAAPVAPALASAHSQAVALPAPPAQPAKVQARIIVPAEPAPIRPPVISTDPEPSQDPAAEPAATETQQAAGAPGIRQIPLGGGRAIDQAAPAAAPAPPAAALGFVAPVPPPRPANAP
ncbi:hypothetical protein [Phreatobacter sp.]|uniref:hypothetical protein n=1 Tax=Phreatobacter sp. TaxID=1966341 RepID=UPI003F6EB406